MILWPILHFFKDGRSFEQPGTQTDILLARAVRLVFQELCDLNVVELIGKPFSVVPLQALLNWNDAMEGDGQENDRRQSSNFGV